jgi:hypothetical protein
MVPDRVSCWRCRHGSQSSTPAHSTSPTRNRLPTRSLGRTSRTTTWRRRLRPGQAHVLQRLSLDQRQRLARLRAIGAEVPIAPEPLTRERRDRPGRHERLAGGDIDLLGIHKPIMAAATRSANRITAWCVAAADSTEVIESPASEESGCCP